MFTVYGKKIKSRIDGTPFLIPTHIYVD